jgi:8-oxo-dGTP diphosphatase
MWEFPGGKKHPDETLEEALARELSEELGVTAKIGPEMHRTQHRYAEMSEPIEIVFFAATAAPPDMRNLVFERMEWCEPKNLPELNFLPADRELIEKLASGDIQLPRFPSA